MAGSENLIPNSQRSKAVLSAMGAEGGRKSGEKRRLKRTMQQAAAALLNATPKKRAKAIRELEELGWDINAEGDPTVMMLMLNRAVQEALDGDWDAFKIVLDVAQVPGIKAKIEREKIKAQREARARVDLTVNSAEGQKVMDEIAARMDAEAPESDSE